ncbi:MAG: DUF177 domain-containing protein [Candidatus Aminicenantes bacterium]|nr:DUF177 domain-containing protein [Candidatus Aminicenantes bacterium]
MIIEIDRLSEEELKISQNFDFLSTDLVDENVVFRKPVHADISIKRIEEEIFIKGQVTTQLSFICSRCLSPYEMPVDSQFDLIYLSEEIEELGEQLHEGDMNRFFYMSPAIDLLEVVLEQVNLTFPIKPLCSNDCQGLCPICGKIEKEGDCHCVTHDSDPRMNKLKIFLRDKR